MWRPVLTLDELEDDTKDMRRGAMVWWPDGLASSEEERVSAFRCSFDFKDMPFDSHACSLTLILPNSVQKMKLQFRNAEMNEGYGLPGAGAIVVSNLGNSEWEIQKPENWKLEEGIELERDDFGTRMHLSALRWNFKFRRKPRFMMMNYVLPTIMFYLVSWLGLWLDPRSVPARVAIGVIPILIITNKLNAASLAMPPISYATRLESFLLASLMFSVAHMLEYGLVNGFQQVHRQATERKDSRTIEVTQSEESGLPKQEGVQSKFARILSMFERFSRTAPIWVDRHVRWMSLVVYAIVTVVLLYG